MPRADLFTDQVAERDVLLARWLELTRTVLPAMAERHGWPIRLDHCFMRVCLDGAVGAPWTVSVDRPAVRHLTDAQLASAVGIAESLIADPDRLPVLNATSLASRKVSRSGGDQSAAPR